MISTLAKMLRLNDEQAEASLHSEGAARAVLGRRNLMLVGAALVAGTAFSFGHSTMSLREFQRLMQASLPGRQLSFERGFDMYRDTVGDSNVITTVISGGNRKASKFSVNLTQLDSSPFVRERLQSALARHVGYSTAIHG